MFRLQRSVCRVASVVLVSVAGGCATPPAAPLAAHPAQVTATAPPVTVLPESQDDDCDGLSNRLEAWLQTDPHNPDTDGDGLSDGLELGRVTTTDCRSQQRAFASYTSPLARDTDGDGLDDNEEDTNLDGRRNFGETSPTRRDSDGDGVDDGVERLAHSNAARDLEVPEPMIFDLVRGLRSQKGELEINALVLAVPSDDGRVDLVYAPEVEFAFADGNAIELELPFHNDRLSAIKLAFQRTLGVNKGGSAAHGLQIFGEIGTSGDHGSVVLTHIANLRATDRLALITVAGLAAHAEVELGSRSLDRIGEHLMAHLQADAVVNVTMMHLVDRSFALGVEVNSQTPVDRGFAERMAFRITPQLHGQINHHLRFQVGLGAQSAGAGDVAVVGIGRVIGEL